jgi:hypothetical protein
MPPAREPDPLHPFLRPLWRRILILALCIGWIGFEIVWGGDQFWLILACGATAYAIWDFFLRIPMQRRFRR